MVWIVLIAGLAAITCCLLILIVPRFLRRMIVFFSVGSRLYLGGFIRITLGVLLLLFASQSRLWGYVVAVGLIVAAAGLSVFFFGLRRIKQLLLRIQNQSNLVLRLYAIFGLAIWALLVYALLP